MNNECLLNSKISQLLQMRPIEFELSMNQYSYRSAFYSLANCMLSVRGGRILSREEGERGGRLITDGCAYEIADVGQEFALFLVVAVA